MLIQEIVYLKKRWSIYNKSWWIWINSNSLDRSISECWRCNILCDRFVVEYIQREIRKLIGNKNIITNIYRIQAYDSIMCG